MPLLKRYQLFQIFDKVTSMDTLPIINRVYDLYKHVVEINAHLEKQWRYSLGISLENTILDLLSSLIMAKNAPKAFKPPYLIKASSAHEIAILKLRLMLELEVVNETKIFQAQAKLEEIGRMLGGWLRSLNTQ